MSSCPAPQNPSPAQRNPNRAQRNPSRTRQKQNQAQQNPNDWPRLLNGVLREWQSRLLAGPHGLRRSPATSGTIAGISDYHKKIPLRARTGRKRLALPFDSRPVCRARYLPDEQRDKDKSNDRQRATAEQDIAQMVSRMTRAHRLLVRFRHDGLFVRVVHRPLPFLFMTGPSLRTRRRERCEPACVQRKLTTPGIVPVSPSEG